MWRHRIALPKKDDATTCFCERNHFPMASRRQWAKNKIEIVFLQIFNNKTQFDIDNF